MLILNICFSYTIKKRKKREKTFGKKITKRIPVDVIDPPPTIFKYNFSHILYTVYPYT